MSEENALERGVSWLSELLQLAGLPSQVTAEWSAIGSLSLADSADDRSEAASGFDGIEDPDQPNLKPDLWLKIDATHLSPEQIDILIGHQGGVLDAIQYLGNTTLNLHQKQGGQQAYTVELNGYRQKRQTELKALAEEAAAQVRATHREFEIQSLSSAERRLVHTFLQTCSDLETFSRGREPDRRLVVRYQQNGDGD